MCIRDRLRIGCSSQVELEILEIPLIKLREEFPTVYPQIIIQDYFILKSLFDNKQLDILISTKEMIAEAHDYICLLYTSNRLNCSQSVRMSCFIFSSRITAINRSRSVPNEKR